ncbi:MAG TPA: hypothetical protein VM843_03555 [Flavisolibacter sp.]|nr:hypothetical protein [Flavisolibacter sp.]
MKNQEENAAVSTETVGQNNGSDKDLTRAKNPNPRANENTDGDALEDGSADGVGSEITDGEAS